MPDKPFAEVSFYIVAHADDWQLFMQPNAYNDLISSNSKIVFVITTAGDAGDTETYQAAREEGMKSSIRFCLAPLTILTEKSGSMKFNDHTINYWSVNNVICYFLRLPDGNLSGNGFSRQGYQSLYKLRAGHIATVTATDNSAIYCNWADFYTTLQAIILFEHTATSDILINYLNPDTTANPNDHPDHTATGQAIQEMTNIPGLRQALFTGYNVSRLSENLPPADLFWKAGMFAAYEKAVFDCSGYSTLHEDVSAYLKWCLKSANFITLNPQSAS